MSKDPTRPDWSEEIRRLYLSSAANQFVVHGNVSDRLLLAAKEGATPKVGNLIDYLTEVQLEKFDLVLS